MALIACPGSSINFTISKHFHTTTTKIVLVAESNKLFFSGKSIFTLNERYGNKLCYLGKDEYVARQPFEIEDFEAYCTDVDGNRDEFVDIAAGGSHFVVLTSNQNCPFSFFCFFFTSNFPTIQIN